MERRHATPHYRHSAEKEYVLATAATFLVGAMLGAVITLGLMV